MDNIFKYDPETGELYWKVGKQGVRLGRRAGNKHTSTKYIRVMVDYRMYQAHDIAWRIYYGFWPPSRVYHKNGVRHDNRICNLTL